MSRLVVVSGLPGAGKTTLARGLVDVSKAAYLRVDVVVTPLVRAGVDVGPLGYEIVREPAASNLAAGTRVVVDLVNPLPITRQMWTRLAAEQGVPLIAFSAMSPKPLSIGAVSKPAPPIMSAKSSLRGTRWRAGSTCRGTRSATATDWSST